MTQFDMLLRRALMDANLAQYERALQSVEAVDPDFSPGYLRERMRVLADPWRWERERTAVPCRSRRLNWRLIAIVAALLILSACAYALVTGQFTQWFPSRGVNPQAPEVSEEVLSRTGTVIEQSRTEGNATLTLNAAVWDGESLLLSLVLECPDVPEEYTPGPSGPYGNGLHTAECYVSMREDQWVEYEKIRQMDYYIQQGLYLEQLEGDIQAGLAEGRQRNYGLMFTLIEREEDVLTFEVHMSLGPYVERPELTLHMEKLSFFGDDKFHIDGPFDFTFTLEKTLPNIRYRGGVVETTLGKPPLREVPLRFTEFEVTVKGLTATGEVLAPVDLGGGFPPWVEIGEDVEPLRHEDLLFAFWEGPFGLWTEDGNYVDLTNAGPSMSGGVPEETLEAHWGFDFPYPIDPATVTALKIGGVRVELSEWKRQDG